MRQWQHSAANSFALQHCCCLVAVCLTRCLQWYFQLCSFLSRNCTQLPVFVAQ